MAPNIFERMLAGGIIRKDEMAEAWDIVARAQRLSVFAPFYTNFGWHIKLGKNIFINHACSFLDLGGITIEDDVQIGPRANIVTENHPLDPAKRKDLDLKPVVLKRNAWIGAGATILPGVTVGENSIVAAGACRRQRCVREYYCGRYSRQSDKVNSIMA